MPYADRERKRQWDREYYHANKAASNRGRKHRTRNRPSTPIRPFIGVDGEGGNINGRHQYLHLRAGSHVLETGRPLTSLQCLDFLASLPNDGLYVSFFFTYDVTMILRDLPEKLIRSLLDIDGRTNGRYVRRVWWGPYGIDFTPGKEFRVCKHTDRTNKTSPKWTVISDTAGFFQTSFVNALKQWEIGSEQLRARIAASKAKRSDFEHVTPLTRLYCKKECDLLAELMERFRDVVKEIGPQPSKWQGPGNLASAWLRRNEVPHDQSNVPDRVRQMAQESYYGGRFEITAVGPIRRRVYQYDINSAYPASMPGLPCLLHGEWRHEIGDDVHLPRNGLYVAHVRFNVPGKRLSPFPIRSESGNIHNPKRGNGTYWSHEIAPAKKAGVQIRCTEIMEYIPHCDCAPFAWVPPLYAERKRIGKTAKGMALKLVLNSLYGKMAQSIGRPKWANPVWAACITSWCRGQIIAAAAQVPEENVLMIATDGIFTDVPLDLPCSDKLGEWDATEHDDLFIVQPGIYMHPSDIKKLPKTRGLPQRELIRQARGIRKEYAENASGVRPSNLSYPVDLTRFLALRQAIALNRWDDAGTWFSETRKLSYDWTTKRAQDGRWDLHPSALRPGEDCAYRPAPLPGSNALESVPYDRQIGMLPIWSEHREWEADQPEGVNQL